MDRQLLLALVIVFGLLLLALMITGWRTRRMRQRELPAPPTAPVPPADVVAAFTGKYVATSRADQPLERIVAHGLGFRGKATTTVTADGILIDRVGERAVWIPRQSISDVRRSTWTIDRVVEPDGLNLIAWSFGGIDVDTTLRLDDPAGFDDAISPLLTSAPTDPEGAAS